MVTVWDALKLRVRLNANSQYHYDGDVTRGTGRVAWWRCQFGHEWKATVHHRTATGDPTPSHADVQMTQQIVAVASPLGIAVHDHIIVGKEGHASLKGLKLI